MFRASEIIKACAGKLIQGKPADKFDSISTDTRTLKANEAFLALKGQNFDGHDFIAEALKLKAGCIILERKPDCLIPEDVVVIQVKDTTLALGSIACFTREKFSLPVIAVTGSNGKTTTKEMISWVLSTNSQVLKNEGTKNNQIGLPQTLIRLSDKDKYAVVEIGTNHFGEVDYLAKICRPNIGLITNVGLSHIEFLKNLNGVLKEKSSLLDSLAEPYIAVLNADDKLLGPIVMQNNKKRHVFSFGINERSDFNASAIKLNNCKVEFKVNSKSVFALSTLGYYNIYNALGAIAVGRILGFSYPEISARLGKFKFPKGRLNFIEFNGLNFIDDTYNSNPLSFKAALMALNSVKCKGRKILIMGDMLELGNQKELLHRQVGRGITDICDVMVAVGSLAQITAGAAIENGFKSKNIFYCGNSLEARDLLFNKLSPSKRDLILVKGSRSMRMEEILK